MANERRAYGNFVSGTLSASLTNVATSMSSAGLANLPVIDTTNYAVAAIENEIVWITAHTAGATTATIVRGQEGTTGAAHSSGVAWQHGPTALDLSRLWNPPACRVYNNANISVADSTLVTVTFNSERYDTDSMHDTVTNNSRLTIVTAGVYLVVFNGQFASRSDYFRVYCDLVLNGATTLANSATGSWNGVSLQPSLGVQTVYKFAAGDYVTARVYQDNNANVAANLEVQGNFSPEFSATWIGLG